MESILVFNEARLMCCGQRREECTCGDQPTHNTDPEPLGLPDNNLEQPQQPTPVVVTNARPTQSGVLGQLTWNFEHQPAVQPVTNSHHASEPTHQPLGLPRWDW